MPGFPGTVVPGEPHEALAGMSMGPDQGDGR